MKTETTDRSEKQQSRSRGRSDIAWLIVALIVIGVIVVLFRTVRDEAAGQSVTVALRSGDRPLSPPLPVRRIAGMPSTVAVVPRDRRGPGRARAPRRSGPTVVYFWASWCGPCRTEAPMMQRIARQYRARGVVVVGVNASDEDLRSDAVAFVREHGLTYPIVASTERERRAWGVRAFPETFVVGADGRVSTRVPGAVDLTIMRRVLDAELARG